MEMTLWEALGAVGASFGVSFGASLLPVGGGVEVYLLATSALLPRTFVAPLVLASAAGSVGAKVLVFLGAARAAKLPKALKEGKGAQVLTRIQEGPWIRRGVILLSTTLSVPPYYVLAVAAGALRTPLSEFLVVGLLGQSARFAVVWALPQMASGVAGG